MFDTFKVIHVYSRANAIEDGTLVDVSPAAKAIGFKVPVAISATLFETILSGITPGSSSAVAVINHLLASAISEIQFSLNADQIEFQFGMRRTKVICHIGPGDTPEPVITIMTSADL